MAQKSVDEAFIFLKPGSDPAADRAVHAHTGARTLLVSVPDAVGAARVAAEAVDAGARHIELYRGFDLPAAAAVIEAVGGRASVGVARYGYGEPDRAATGSTRHWATIYSDERAKPDQDRVLLEHRDGGATTVVGAPDDAMVDVAAELVRAGVDVIEICGGTPLTVAAQVAASVPGVPVGHVTFPFESVDGVAAYKAAYESSLQAGG